MDITELLWIAAAAMAAAAITASGVGLWGLGPASTAVVLACALVPLLLASVSLQTGLLAALPAAATAGLTGRGTPRSRSTRRARSALGCAPRRSKMARASRAPALGPRVLGCSM